MLVTYLDLTHSTWRFGGGGVCLELWMMNCQVGGLVNCQMGWVGELSNGLVNCQMG